MLGLHLRRANGTHGNQIDNAGRDGGTAVCRRMVRQMFGRCGRVVVVDPAVLVVVMMARTHQVVDFVRDAESRRAGRVPSALHGKAMQWHQYKQQEAEQPTHKKFPEMGLRRL